MESLIEQVRRLHEERERLMDLMVKEMSVQPKTQRELINRDTRVKWMCDRYIECSKQLRTLYEDKEGLMKSEIDSMTGPSEFGEFYSRLKVIKEFYKRAPNEVSVPLSVEFAELEQLRTATSEEAQTLVAFSDEEGYGRYLDLHDIYNRYINLRLSTQDAQKSSAKIDYLTFVRTFDRLYETEKARKLQHANAYAEYLRALIDYLFEYACKVKPLLDFDEELERIETEFNKNWDSNTFPGWSKEATSALAHGGAVLDLSGFRSATELESVGMDRLKSALQALGLKCGGTLQERATRLFATKNKRVDQLDASLFAKNAKKPAENERDRAKDLGWLEAQVYWLAELLGEQRKNTAENVERRQALSYAERQAELEDEHGDLEDGGEAGARAGGDGGDDEGVLYNPKDVPLGWDGKPIPYWLYKLHGLNLYYECEICGQVKYRGPKAFARHFQEWRHSHGMRALGIPNTTHFQNIIKIDDALALWKTIQDKKEKERWKADQDEEYEDSMGNVLNKKMYEDLKKQGVL